MNVFAVCMSLTSAVWGVLFLATRVSLFATGHAIARDHDAQNYPLRVKCMNIAYREELGTKAHICDEAFQEAAVWPMWRALDHTWQGTHLCGGPCDELATTVMGNPITLAGIFLLLLALPYVSMLLTRASRHASSLDGYRPSNIGRLEDGDAWVRKSKVR
jgi:hypothetical protein